MLASHFLAGLTPRIKREPTGTIDQLLVKARLEEAKQKEWQSGKPLRTTGQEGRDSHSFGQKEASTGTTAARGGRSRDGDGEYPPNIVCHTCKGRGHV